MGGGNREGGRAANPPASAIGHAIDIDFEEVAMNVVDRAAADFKGEAQALESSGKKQFISSNI